MQKVAETMDRLGVGVGGGEKMKWADGRLGRKGAAVEQLENAEPRKTWFSSPQR